MRLSRLEIFGIGLFLGALTGAAATLLLAPATGARTRGAVRDRLLGVADAARVVASRAEHAAEVISERVDHYLGHDEERAWRRIREIREGVERYTHTQPTA